MNEEVVVKSGGARAAEERWFASFDGAELFYRHWPASQASVGARKAVVLLHRGHEHSGRVEHLVPELGLEDCDFSPG
ncbi:hydrolase, alpha/beta domain protein, partial [Catenibacterium mitsuokai DSM 15897]